jgi:hypothetical protein
MPGLGGDASQLARLEVRDPDPGGAERDAGDLRAGGRMSRSSWNFVTAVLE